MLTEKEKMLAGESYDACDAELLVELNATKELIWNYNNLRPSQRAERTKMLKQLLGKTGEEIFIVQPFYCDYGTHITVGEDFFANFNFTVLDEARVTIGDHAFIGPNVSIYTACHPLDATTRNKKTEWAKPVTIGHNVWIGGSVTICPGVTIGNNVVIGAGSVVVKDIPDNTVAVGNPACPVKQLKN